MRIKIFKEERKREGENLVGKQGKKIEIDFEKFIKRAIIAADRKGRPPLNQLQLAMNAASLAGIPGAYGTFRKKIKQMVSDRNGIIREHRLGGSRGGKGDRCWYTLR